MIPIAAVAIAIAIILDYSFDITLRCAFDKARLPGGGLYGQMREVSKEPYDDIKNGIMSLAERPKKTSHEHEIM